MSLVNNKYKELIIEIAQSSWNEVLNFMTPISFKCAIELGIPDIIHNNNVGQSITLSKLVETLKINPSKTDSIRRLMRLLTHTSFFALKNKTTEEDEEEYILTSSSRVLPNNESPRSSSSSFLELFPSLGNSFNEMSKWFLDNRNIPTIFEFTEGMTFWAYLAKEPEVGKIFQELMSEQSEKLGKFVVSECKDVFKGLKSFVDVGGGTGTLAKAISDEFPEIMCTVFDLPHVVQNLKGTNNLEFVGGDIFHGIPSADAVLLKWILHNFEDKDCVKILKSCKEAIPSKEKGGKLILVEMIINESQEEDTKEDIETKLCSDMLMMAISGGKERTLKQWKNLFLAAGFNDYKIHSKFRALSLIEVYH